MSFGQQPYENTMWLSLSWWMCMETRKSSVQDCNNLAMTVHCVTLTCCSCHRHGKHLRVCETTVPFVLVDLNADKSPAHKVSVFQMGSLPYAHELQSPCVGPTTFGCNAHTGNRHQQLWSLNTSLPQLASSSLLAQLDVQQRSSNHQYRFSTLFAVSCVPDLCFVATAVAF